MKFLASLIPVLKYRIEENSMSPYLQVGDLVIIFKTKNSKVGDVVVFKKSQDYFIKRVTEIKGESLFLEGDNKKESADSRKFGWFDKKDIVGKVIYKI